MVSAFCISFPVFLSAITIDKKCGLVYNYMVYHYIAEAERGEDFDGGSA